MPKREVLRRRWDEDVQLGTSSSLRQSEHRRVVLANQMALLGALFTLVYALLSLIYDVWILWPFLAIAPPILLGYGGVLWLNSDGRYLKARLILAVLPPLQITFSAWLYSTQSGVQLHFFVLWTVLFLLYKPKERWLFIATAFFWIGLYTWIQTRFHEPVLELWKLYSFMGWDILNLIFAFNAATAFALVGATIALFYREIKHTEDKLNHEYQRSQELLENILPKSVAEQLKDGDIVTAESRKAVTLLFADIVGFTRLSGELPPTEVVELLNRVFSNFDDIVERHGLEKIKTIGDEYMLAGGLPDYRPDHAQAVANAALDMLAAIEAINKQVRHKLEVRIGMHTGEVVAGVIGSRKFSYDVWGDTVNTASRMQTHGLRNRIQVTDTTAELLQDDFHLEQRRPIRVRGKGRMSTWFLLGRKNRE